MSQIIKLKQAIKLCGAARITPFLWGERGMGKSSIVRQLAAEEGWGFIDERCSQMEASDLRGLPDRHEGRTVYLPPASMPQGDLSPDRVRDELLSHLHREINLFDPSAASPEQQHAALLRLVDQDMEIERRYEVFLRQMQPRFQRGILFLDELNRAGDDVQQAAFQLVLDYAIGTYVLPPGWFVVVAGNYNEGYQVSGFSDPAFLDRFCHLTFPAGDPTLEDWINYMGGLYGEDASETIEFVSQNVKHLDGDLNGQLGFSVQPSRRSWDALTRVRKVARHKKFDDETLLLVMQGLVGYDLANQFSRYSCPVKPKDVITRGVKALSREMGGLNRGQLTGLMWGIQYVCKPRITEQKISDVCLDFAEWLARHERDKDLTVAFCRSLVHSGGGDQERARAAVISNPKLAGMIADFNRKSGGEKSFIDKLCDRPSLQGVLSDVAWGGSGREED